MAIAFDEFQFNDLMWSIEKGGNTQQPFYFSQDHINEFVNQLKATTNEEINIDEDSIGDKAYTFPRYEDASTLKEALKPHWANFKDAVDLATKQRQDIEQSRSTTPQTPSSSQTPSITKTNRDSGFFDEEKLPHFDIEKPEETHVQHDVDHNDFGNPSAPTDAAYLAEEHQYNIEQDRSNAPQTSSSSQTPSVTNRDSAFFGEEEQPYFDFEKQEEHDVEHGVDYSDVWSSNSPTFGSDTDDIDDHNSIISSSSSPSRRNSTSTINSSTSTAPTTPTTSRPTSPEPSLKVDTDSTVTRQEPLTDDFSHIGAEDLPTTAVVLTYEPYAMNPAFIAYSTTSTDLRVQEVVKAANKFTNDIAYEMQKAAENPEELQELTTSLHEHYNGMIEDIAAISHGVPPQVVLQSSQVQTTRPSSLYSSISTTPISKSSRLSSSAISSFEDIGPSADEFTHIEEAQIEETQFARAIKPTEIRRTTVSNSQPNEPLVITHTPYENDPTLKIHSTTSTDLRIKNVVRDANKFTIDTHLLMQRAKQDGNVEKLHNLTGSLKKHYQVMELAITLAHGRQPSLQAQAIPPLPATNLSHDSPATYPQPEHPQNSPTAVNAIESQKITDPTFGDTYTIYATKDPSVQSRHFVDQTNTKVSELLTITRNSMGNPDAYNTNSKLLNSYYNEVNKAVAAYNDRKRYPQQQPTQAAIDHDALALAAAEKYVKENMRAANGAHQFIGGIQQETLTEHTQGEHTLVPVHTNDTHTWSVEIPHPSKNPPQKRLGKLLKAVTNLLWKHGIKPVIGQIMKVDMSRSQNQIQDQSQHISSEEKQKKPGKTH